MVEERRTSMDSTGKEANFGRDTRPPVQQPITSDATQQLTRKRKGKSPMKSARKKMTVRKYRTRSTTTFISKFSGNDKEPITLD
nr:hypothetical protein Itr_chr08CG20380 [Ipomoea trifida]